MSKKRNLAKRVLHYYLQNALRHKWLFAINIISPILGVIFGSTLFRYYLAMFVEKLSQYGQGATKADIYHMLWLVILMQGLELIFWRVNDYTAVYRQSMALRDLEQSVFEKLGKHSYRFFADNFAGSLVTQFNRFVRSYHTLENILLFRVMVTGTIVIASITLLMFIAPIMGIVMLIWSAFFLVSVTYLVIRKSPLTQIDAAAESKVTANLADSLTNMINIKIFARHSYERKRFKQVSNQRLATRRHSWSEDIKIRNYRWVMVVIFIVSYLFISAHLVVTGQVSVGVVLTAQLFMISIYQQLFDLNQTIQEVEQAFSEAAEMTEILDTEYEVDDPKNPEPVRIKHGKIEFDSVQFRYSEAGNDVFSKLDLVIPAGQKVGLVGHSGSGKSTLTRLLVRFADIQEGKILIDGQDISRIRQHDLRSQIAFVPQEPILFHRSIIENIRYGRIEASDEEVHKAAKLANAADFIDKLPKRYDTLVGERGIKLSGGEKQRVAIARAMLSKAPILLLDEATSALDSKSEKLINEALDNLMKNRTTIVIAHRLSTIRKMDRILVMSNGQIVEEGDHSELLAAKGEYAELWSHQTGNFLEE